MVVNLDSGYTTELEHKTPKGVMRQESHSRSGKRPKTADTGAAPDPIDSGRRRLARAVALWGGYAAAAHVPYQSPVIRSFLGVRRAYAQATGPIATVTPTDLAPTALGSCTFPIVAAPSRPRATADTTFQVENTGTIPVTLHGVTSDNPAITIVGPGLPQTIDPGQALVVAIRLTCTATGAQNASLTLDVRSAVGPVTTPTVNVQGTCGLRSFSLTPGSLDFGNVMIGSSKDLTTTLRNTGTEPLSVLGFTLSDTAYTVVSQTPSAGSPLSLDPNATSVVTVRMTCPAGTSPGAHAGTLEVIATAGAGPLSCATVSLQGTCATEGCSISPTSLDFGLNAVSSTKDLDFTITNTGSVDITVTGLSSTDGNYSIVAPASLPVTIAAGASQTVTVRLTCPSTPGTSSGQIDITGSTVFGSTDCGPVPVTGRWESAGCSISPTSLDFGQLIGAGTKDLTFTITNIGSIDLDVTGLATTNASYTIQSPTTPVTIAPGASQTVTVRLTCPPTGTQTGNVNITSSTAFGSEDCGPVPLTGDCDVLDCDVSPVSLDFGMLNSYPDTTFDKTFTITNTGTLPFTVDSLGVTSSGQIPQFSIQPPTPTTPFTLTAGQSAIVTVRAFCTSDTPGMATGTVTINMSSNYGQISCGPVSLQVECVNNG